MGELDDLHARLLNDLVTLTKDPKYIAYHAVRTTMRPQDAAEEYERDIKPELTDIIEKLRLIKEIVKIQGKRRQY